MSRPNHGLEALVLRLKKEGEATMQQATLLTELGLSGNSLPSCVHWVMRLFNDEPILATARLDYDEKTGAIELSIHEFIEGDGTHFYGAAQLNQASGMITFLTDEGERFCERFCETVKLMEIEVQEEV